MRWPDGFVCPGCEGRDFWATGAGLCMCRACGRRTSLTAGTIFHRTRTPLSTWFAAVRFVTSQKNGMSAQSLQRVLGLKSYETAWAWMHKLRRAMVRPERDLLSGVVEVDETFVGGVSIGRSAASTTKATVMVAVEKPGPGRKLGRIRLGLADRPNTLGLVAFATNSVVPGSSIHTDGARMMRRLSELGYTHEYDVRGISTAEGESTPGGFFGASTTLTFAVCWSATLNLETDEVAWDKDVQCDPNLSDAWFAGPSALEFIQSSELTALN
ncbi:IS1595 family transposase [Agromyces sp. MMS17-SY077]|uniref:IS1595 family transposase n=1 Tax=Agromyces seonyuensis TaxID=2662446 RepID=A0A6I4NWT1_9MICO|nr:IS1595 family transposase [Agromyces seonyuensis]